MRIVSRITAIAGAAVLAAAFTAATAGASVTPHAGVVTASTFVTTPDNGHGTPAHWADDSFTETTAVVSLGTVDSSYCAPQTGPCHAYTAPLGVSDKGQFNTIRGAGAPNQAPGRYAGNTITAVAAGSLTGTVTYSEFYSVQKPGAAFAPRSLHGVSDTGTYPALLFADPSEVHGLSIVTYDFRYRVTIPSRASGQRWDDSSAVANDDGNAFGDGQITG